MATILWIDDHAGRKTAQELGFDGLMYFVRQNGHVVHVASTTRDIKSALGSLERYDLVVLDILMDSLPGSTDPQSRFGGLDALEEMRRCGGIVPVVVLSVVPPDKVEAEAMRRRINLREAGVVELLEKGILRPSAIAAVVEKHLCEKVLEPALS